MKNGAILTGDIGGTNTRFALARPAGGRILLSEVWKRPGADFPTFDAAFGAYLETLDRDVAAGIAGACFGLAGPVRGGRVDLLHRGWVVETSAIQAKLNLSAVVLVNDFIAMARAAPDMTNASREDGASQILIDGEADDEGAIAVGGPGTGFGVAVLRRYAPEGRPDETGWIVVGGEGGHQAFGPQTDLECRVADILRAKLGYVSNEHIASGSGFSETLDALAQAMGVRNPGWSEQELLAEARAGEALGDAMCRLRAATVMTAMGDMALFANATGGVVLAGGITTRITPWLTETDALDRFFKRGPRTELVSKIPISLIRSDDAPLIGAARLWLDNQARGWL